MTNSLGKIISGCALIGIAALALFGARPPAVSSTTAPPNEFSSARAVALLSQFALQPHPIGTDENKRARDYLCDALRGLGAEVQVEDTRGCFSRGRMVRAGLVHNIVATLRGTASQRAVMLVAHYDSVPEGAGAADDGAGVVAILETLHALKNGTPLKNDLIVLLSDGEEAGLLGASAFAADHPDLAARIGVALNLEARGSSGPALMFETSENNGWLIREFARAAPYPMASSLMYSVYKLLPNDTDFTPLKRTGLAGFNFAFMEKFQDYHSRLDSIENLDPRSVQHMGANALALTQHFGNATFPDKAQADVIYFNWFGHWLVAYPVWLSWLFAVCGLAMFAVFFVLARSQIKPSHLIAGFGSFVLLLVVIGATSLLAWYVLSSLVGHPAQVGDTWSNLLLFLGVLTLGLTSGAGVLVWLENKVGLRNLCLGQILAGLVLTLVVIKVLPGASYVVQWPIFFGLLALIASRRSELGSLLAAPALLILVPLVYLFFVALDLNVASIGAAVFLMTILLVAVLPLFLSLVRPLLRTAILLLFLAFLCLTLGAILSRSEAKHPRRDTIAYSINADQNKAQWISYDAAPDGWTSLFLGRHPPKGVNAEFTIGSDRPCLVGDAPIQPLLSPIASVIQDSTENGARILTLHVRSNRGATALVVRLSADVKMQSATWNGCAQELGDRGKATTPWYLRFDGLPAEGVDLQLRFLAQQSVKLWVGDSSFGLPQLSGQSYSDRPPEMMAGPGSDVTLAGRQYAF
ncbi:MAG: M28 family peptidase [Verrucomicrobiota bacterium]|nr:M28 family peptidase [Verrucomicrobiota bacterium]